jgi:hypothetical protein
MDGAELADGAETAAFAADPPAKASPIIASMAVTIAMIL